ncbi:hypothetical protein NG819_08220 [Pseudarthrobacter sp. Fe7]|nr:hypothetical protein NG819_08220 [Pseudarthrobacter sp. Fe7]
MSLLAATVSLAIPAAGTVPAATAADIKPGQWTSLAAGPAPASNPLQGFVPYAGKYDALPYSMEWFYIPVNAVVTGAGTYNWSALDAQLNSIASRGHQAVFRFYLDYPGRRTGVPQYLLDAGLATHPYADYGNQGVSVSPDYDDPRLVQAMDAFIAGFGARYDGDPRIGFIEMGLLGFWGSGTPTRMTDTRHRKTGQHPLPTNSASCRLTPPPSPGPSSRCATQRPPTAA